MTTPAAPGPMLAHMVYFSLVDNSPEACRRMVESCRQHLAGHPGTVLFAAGTLCGDLDRPVNVRDWDVALQVVFADRAAHDRYQTDPRHLRFIEENKPNWKQVRVFDANVTGAGG